MRKYIAQQTYNDFVYPNNNVAIYDVNDVVQNINNNSVSGTTSGFTASITSTGLTISFNYIWSKNSAEVFVSASSLLHLFSIHVMPAGLTYFKPWRLVDLKTTSSTGSTTSSGSYSSIISASSLGLASFTSGTYYFEIRFIGGLQNYIVTQQSTLTL